QAQDDKAAEGHEEKRRRQAVHHDRADRSANDLCALLRSGGGLWGVALSGLSAVLLGRQLLAGRRRTPRYWIGIRRGLCRRTLGGRRELLGWRCQLGRQQHQRQSAHQYQQQRQQLESQRRSPPRRALQQQQRCQQIQQGQQHP